MSRRLETIPKGWAISRLEELTSPVSTNGKKVKTKDAQSSGTFPVIDQGIQAQAGYLNDPALLVMASRSTPVILFGDHTRVVKYITRDFIPGADGTKLMRAKPRISPRYLQYVLKSIDIPSRGYGRHYQFLQSAELPVAPESEQGRIADKLDTVLTRVDTVNTRLARLSPILKRFRQSVLAAATSGRLSGRMRTDDQLSLMKLGNAECRIPSSWGVTTLAQQIDPLRPLCYGVVQPGVETRGGVPLIRVQDMERGSVSIAELRTVEEHVDQEFSRSKVVAGDVLVSVVGTIGRIAVVPPAFNGNIARAVARVAPVEGIEGSWLRYWLESPEVQWWLTSSSKEVARKTLNLGDLAKLPVPLPTKEEQAEIVRRIEDLFAFADRIEAQLQAAQTATDRLTPALLAKAFRGELVPQDPSDEPASELLRRLHTEAPDSKPKRGRKTAA